jgi:hypothetical protein
MLIADGLTGIDGRWIDPALLDGEIELVRRGEAVG